MSICYYQTKWAIQNCFMFVKLQVSTNTKYLIVRKSLKNLIYVFLEQCRVKYKFSKMVNYLKTFLYTFYKISKISCMVNYLNMQILIKKYFMYKIENLSIVLIKLKYVKKLKFRPII